MQAMTQRNTSCGPSWRKPSLAMKLISHLLSLDSYSSVVMASQRLLRVLQLHAERLATPSRRTLSTSPSPQPAGRDSYSRLRRLNDRLPRFLRSYTTPLLGAPVIHVTSFLILHEITAIVPLFGLVYAFHYANWIPNLTSKDGDYNAFDEGAERLARYMKKKGWVNEADVDTVAEHEVTEALNGGEKHNEEIGVKLMLECATAYAITKALLPVRLAASVWATPWFARTILIPMGNVAGRLFRRG